MKNVMGIVAGLSCFLFGTGHLQAADLSFGAGEFGSPIGFLEVRQTLVWNADFTDFDVELELLNVEVLPGWTYTVRKAGGVNSAVEVRFVNGDSRFNFKYVNKPGFSFLDGGYYLGN